MSTKTHSSERTTDHETIRRWVEERGGKPATVRSTEPMATRESCELNFPRPRPRTTPHWIPSRGRSFSANSIAQPGNGVPGKNEQ